VFPRPAGDALEEGRALRIPEQRPGLVHDQEPRPAGLTHPAPDEGGDGVDGDRAERRLERLDVEDHQTLVQGHIGRP
jgi:hypothetical protein